MDIVELRKSAENLKTVLHTLSGKDQNVDALGKSLSDYIERSLAGSIQTPIESRDIPGSYLFQETDIRKYRDLEQAYAEFKIEITGGRAQWESVLEKIRSIRASKQHK